MQKFLILRFSENFKSYLMHILLPKKIFCNFMHLGIYPNYRFKFSRGKWPIFDGWEVLKMELLTLIVVFEPFQTVLTLDQFQF